MKKHLLTIILLMLVALANAQNWAPIGAKWTYGRSSIWLPIVEYCDWVSTSDSLVNGHNCRLIKRNGSVAQSDLSDKLITYEDSNRIFLYNTTMNLFTVLYDFNKNAGETWTMTLDTCDLLITVDSTGIDTINGVPLKTLYISSENFAFDGKIIQGIGHLRGPNPDINYHCHNILVDGTFYTGLRCYEDSIIGFHDFGIAPSCYYSTSINEAALNADQISVHPNPFSSQTTIEATAAFDNASLTIFNTFGQQMKQLNNLSGSSIIFHRDNLPSGIYFFRLARPDGTFATGKLVISMSIE